MSDEETVNPQPEGKQKNVTKAGSNLFEDSFFENFGEIEDDLDNLDFSKLGEETKDDIVDFEKLNVITKKEPADKKKQQPVKITSEPLKSVEVPLKKEKKEEPPVNKKLESLGLSDDDPSAKQMAELWDHMSTPDASEYKLMVLRLEPALIKGTKISGYLETFHLPTTIPDIIEQVGQKYGGGKYQIRIVDGTGKYVKSKIFEISGLPKLYQEAAPLPIPPSVEAVNPPNNTAPVSNKKKDEDEEDEDMDEDEEWDDDLDMAPPRRTLRPRQPHDIFYPSPNPYPIPPPIRPGLRRDDSVDVEKIGRDLEEKVVNKLESKFDKLTGLLAAGNQKQDSGLFSPEMLKHLAPIVVSWMDSKQNKDTAHSGQFSEMNNRMVELMRGMQDMVRIQDKSKDEVAEKERREREQTRHEMMEQQRRIEERMLVQQQSAEERFQKMMLSMKETLDSKHQSEISLEQKMRMEFERQREDFRLREEKTREEAKAKEERLREEQRQKEEEARRKEYEFREQMRQEERKWQEEVRRRDDEIRQAESRWREELRQKEVQSLNEAKTKELEIMERIRAVENQKTDVERRLLEQFYSHNSNSKESQLHMELAIAKMSSDNEAKMFQQQAQMELEKMRHATQMQISKMKHDLESIERKPEGEDPLDGALQNYLKKKLQIDMIKELNMDIDGGDVPGNSIKDTIGPIVKGGVETVLGELFKIITGGGAPRPVAAPQPMPGRVVNPTPTPTPAQNPAPAHNPTPAKKATAKVVEETVEEPTPAPQEEVDPMTEITRLAEYFMYLKNAIENNAATPEEAAEEAERKLSPQIVNYLGQVEDSSEIINEIYPLLVAQDTELANFFTKPETVTWLNEMLKYIGGEESEEESEEEETEEGSNTSENDSNKKEQE